MKKMIFIAVILLSVPFLASAKSKTRSTVRDNRTPDHIFVETCELYNQISEMEQMKREIASVAGDGAETVQVKDQIKSLNQQIRDNKATYKAKTGRSLNVAGCVSQ